jgi:hypothetical protein
MLRAFVRPTIQLSGKNNHESDEITSLLSRDHRFVSSLHEVDDLLEFPRLNSFGDVVAELVGILDHERLVVGEEIFDLVCFFHVDLLHVCLEPLEDRWEVFLLTVVEDALVYWLPHQHRHDVVLVVKVVTVELEESFEMQHEVRHEWNLQLHEIQRLKVASPAIDKHWRHFLLKTLHRRQQLLLLQVEDDEQRDDVGVETELERRLPLLQEHHELPAHWL